MSGFGPNAPHLRPEELVGALHDRGSETVIVTFRIEGGTITSVIESKEVREQPWPYSLLTERGDIEDAVARVVNTPVGGREDET